MILYLSNTLSAPLQKLVTHVGNIIAIGNIRREVNGIYEQDILSLPQSATEDIRCIKAEHLQIRKGERALFSDFNKEFLSPYMYLVKGKSGTGKTILLHCLSGLEKSAGGNIYINDISKNINRLLIGKSVYLQQGASLFNTSVQNNITLFEESPDITKLKSVKQRLGIEMNNSRTITDGGLSVSGGERNKILLARAVYLGIRMIFMDEFFSVIDKDSTAEIFCILKEGNIFVICVNHNLGEMESLFDEVISL